MARGDAREGKWRGNWRMEWVASTLTLHRNVVHPALLPLMRTPRLPAVDWTDVPRRFEWTRPFRRKTKSGFCACAITFQTHYTMLSSATFRGLVRPFHSQSIWLQHDCIITERMGFFAEFHKFPKYAKHHHVLHVWIPPTPHKPSIPEGSKSNLQRRQWERCYIVQNTGHAVNFMSHGQAHRCGATSCLPPATHKQIRPIMDAV